MPAWPCRDWPRRPRRPHGRRRHGHLHPASVMPMSSRTRETLAALVAGSLVAACSAAPAQPAKDALGPHTPPQSPVSTITPDPVQSADAPPEPNATAAYTRDLDGVGKLVAVLDTSEGAITCELFEAEAPLTVANFVGLARGLKAFVDPATDRAVT